MEIAYVGCDTEQSAQHRCLFSVSLSLHVYWLEVTLVQKCIQTVVKTLCCTFDDEAEAGNGVYCSCSSSVPRGWKCCQGFGFLLMLPLLLSQESLELSLSTYFVMFCVVFFLFLVDNWQNVVYSTDDLSLRFLSFHQKSTL